MLLCSCNVSMCFAVDRLVNVVIMGITDHGKGGRTAGSREVFVGMCNLFLGCVINLKNSILELKNLENVFIFFLIIKIVLVIVDSLGYPEIFTEENKNLLSLYSDQTVLVFLAHFCSSSY